MAAIEPGRISVSLGLLAAAALFAELSASGAPLVTLGYALFVAGSCALFFAQRRAEPEARASWALCGLLALLLGVASALSGTGAGLGNPLQAHQARFLGLPHQLAWVALGAAALRVRVARHDGRARGLWALATLWALTTLWLPTYGAEGSALPVADLGSQHPWLALVLVLSSLLAVARMLPWLTPIDTDRLHALGIHVLWAPVALGVAHLLELTQAGQGLAAWLGGASLLVALFVLTTNGASALELLAKRAWRPEDARRADLAPPILVLAAFLLLKTHGMGASNTDENIYFYMASRIAEGQWPYVDYFFAHPPLHVILPGLLFTATGFHLLLAKAIAPLACAVSGAALWSLARRHLGAVAAIVSLIAFLFAAEVLKGSTNMTGVNLTVMWLLLGLRSWALEQPRRAGLFFALSLSTGIYAAAAVCAALALGAFRQRRFAGELLLTTAAVFGLVNLIGWWAAPEAFLDGVYRYHGLKAPDAEGYMPLFDGPSNPASAWIHNLGLMLTGRPFIKELFYHAHLWVAGALLPCVVLAQCFAQPDWRGALRRLAPQHLWGAGSRGVALLLWWVSVSLVAQFALFRELYSFYFVLIYPLLALCLGWVVAGSLGLLASSVAKSWPVRTAALRMAAGIALFMALLSWESIAYRAQAEAFPKEVTAMGERVSYTWRPAPALTSLSPVVRHLFWADHRTKGVMERGYRHYLWNKKRALETLPEIATYIRENSSETDTIAGSSTVAPLLALASDRRLAGDEADTNTKRFRTGVLDEAAYWETICRDQVRFLVSTSRSFFTPRRMKGHPIVQRWFRPVKRFDDPQIRHGGVYSILLFERIQDQPVDGRVCL